MFIVTWNRKWSGKFLDTWQTAIWISKIQWIYPSSGLWGGVLDCDSQFTILSSLSFDRPQLWRSVSVCSCIYLLTRAHCAWFFPQSLCGWPRTSLHLLEEGHNHSIVRFAYLCHVISEELVFKIFPFMQIKLLELGVEIAFNNRSTVTTRLIC